MRKTLDIVVPVYNEEECINQTIERLMAVRETLFTELDVNFIFVNDGSKDKSFDILKEHADKTPFIKVINFSRNFGHQFAVSAGIDNSTGDYVAIIDADLQDPPELIKDMYEKTKEGFEVVYGKRLKRKKESAFKKLTAFAFYRIFDSLCQIKIPTDTGDFRLITKDVVDVLKTMPEKHRFIRGMVPWVGFNSTPIYYDRDERFAGVTKYPLSKMLKLAFDGIFSFSTQPIKFINTIAATLLVLALISVVIWTMMPHKFLFFGIASIILFIGALQTFSIAIIGEYVGRIFEEVKNRPNYIIKNKLNF